MDYGHLSLNKRRTSSMHLCPQLETPKQHRDLRTVSSETGQVRKECIQEAEAGAVDHCCMRCEMQSIELVFRKVLSVVDKVLVAKLPNAST